MVADLQRSETIGRSRGLQEFSYVPYVVADASGHRGRDSQALVYPAEIVERKPRRYRRPVVLPLLAESRRRTIIGTSKTMRSGSVTVQLIRDGNAIGAMIGPDLRAGISGWGASEAQAHNHGRCALLRRVLRRAEL
jgi:hypothetical protein